MISFTFIQQLCYEGIGWVGADSVPSGFWDDSVPGAAAARLSAPYPSDLLLSFSCETHITNVTVCL